MAHHLVGGIAAVAVLQLAIGFAAPRSATALTCLTDTTTADFAAGDLGDCYAGERADGEVLLAPTEGTEFSGGSLPAGWALFDWQTPVGANNTSVGGGELTINRARVNPDDPAAYGAGRALEFVAKFGPEQFQHVGFGAGTHAEIFTAPAFAWAMFSTSGTADTLFARSNTGSGQQDTILPGFPPNGTARRYRIEWDAGEVRYYINGNPVPVATHTITIVASMRPAISDLNLGTVPDTLKVDWLRMTAYDSPCTFESRIFDGGNNGANWSDLDAGTVLPGGTGIVIETRSGNTPSPDGTWSLPQALSGNTIQSPTARYLQYSATLSSGDPDETPELEDAQVCYDPCTVTGAEVCDGTDNDCNGQVDEGTVGNPCTSGEPGVCSDGLTTCTMGVPGCDPIIAPGSQTEICDGDDNDCDGSTDEDTSGAVCDTMQPGICAPGHEQCQSGSLVCVQDNMVGTESCNGLDDDCDGSTDEMTGGAMCNTMLPGVCAAGHQQCQMGSLVCVQDTMSSDEVCNNLDDNCNGSTDEGDPGGGGGCTTMQPGICSPGTLHCTGGNLVCQANAMPGMEICNNLDDNCNGTTDEGTSGAGCPTGQPGACGPGTLQCQSGTLNCVQTTPMSTELCQTGQDEDCDGQTDEAGCACAMVETVLSTTQTRINKVRLSDPADRDKVLAKGTFILPAPGLINPVTQVVRIQINDNTGLHYEGVIPASSFAASPSGRRFKYSDATLANDGIKKAKFSIRGDEVTVKYLFQAQGLNQPDFIAGTGTATVIIGTRCFKDSADTCAVSPSGSSAKCR